jgi:hypothetical protein
MSSKKSELLVGRQRHFNLIHETPAPILAGFKGRDDRVMCRSGMLARVSILGIIAAADVSAGSA